MPWSAPLALLFGCWASNYCVDSVDWLLPTLVIIVQQWLMLDMLADGQWLHTHTLIQTFNKPSFIHKECIKLFGYLLLKFVCFSTYSISADNSNGGEGSVRFFPFRCWNPTLYTHIINEFVHRWRSLSLECSFILHIQSTHQLLLVLWLLYVLFHENQVIDDQI